MQKRGERGHGSTYVEIVGSGFVFNVGVTDDDLTLLSRADDKIVRDLGTTVRRKLRK